MAIKIKAEEKDYFGILKTDSKFSGDWGDEFLSRIIRICQADDAFISIYHRGDMLTKTLGNSHWLTWPLDTSPCQYTLQAEGTFTINNLGELKQFVKHPLLWEPWVAMTYAGAPIKTHYGETIGTLFISSRKVCTFSAKHQEDLKFFAKLLFDKIQLIKLTYDLEDKAIHHKAVDQARSLFLSSMSHEIRTPVSGILGMASLALSESNKNDVIHTHLENIHSEANSLLFMVNQVLDFNLLESGTVRLDAMRFCIQDIKDYLNQTLQEEALKRNLLFEIKSDDQCNTWLSGDFIKLKQVLHSLCLNGIKYTEKGKVTLHIQRLNEDLIGSCKVRFDIIDTGIGIRESELKHIFSAFNRVNKKGPYKQFEGAGLGLAIVKKLVAIMGGNIEVQSDPGKGSTFSFEVQFDELEGGPEESSKQDPHLEKPLDGKKVLLVEDNQVNAMIAKRFLTKWGAIVHHEVNGKEAVDHLRDNKDTYQLILMDVQMPVMNGLDASRMIRHELKLDKDKLPIISVTASILQDSLSQSIEAGMNDSITKPFQPDELLNKIIALI